MNNDSYYNILEVPETASIDEIKKSYRRLSMLYHPDKNKNNLEATAKFQKISEAYETLGDEEKKREYDMTRKNPFIRMMSQDMHGMNMNSPEELFCNLFGLNLNGAMPMGFGPNIRVFHNGFPQGMNMGANMQKPVPIVKTISVSIDRILSGTTIPLEIERWLLQDNNKIFETETIYVNVPQGIDEGEMIILREKGNMINENCKGDIKIFIKIENNTDFKRSGLDLIFEKTITVKEALCGFNFELKYITGKIYTITNNSGNIISNGYQKTIPNMGFTREHHTGNLIIIFNVKFPEKLSETTISLLKNIDF